MILAKAAHAAQRGCMRVLVGDGRLTLRVVLRRGHLAPRRFLCSISAQWRPDEPGWVSLPSSISTKAYTCPPCPTLTLMG